jgi:hypothetical protein
MNLNNGLETISGNTSVYPNPAKDNIYVSLSSAAEEATIQVYDMNGRLVISGIHRLAGKKNIAISIATLQPGTYVVKVQSAGTTASVKLIKQ